jgi:YVTN family beta-propeller protein
VRSCRRAYGGRVATAVSLAFATALSGLVSGCRSPVPFRGGAGPDAPVAALGAPVPYIPSPRASPPVLDQRGNLPEAPPDIYADTQAGFLSTTARGLPRRVYVPDAGGAAVDVVDPGTYRVLRRIPVGRAPQQVVPSWDLKTLWVTKPTGLVPINARTGVAGRTVPVKAPSNLYFSVDGRTALVLDSRRGRIDLRDPHTMRHRSTLRVPCTGLTRADFSATGDTLVVGCATPGRLARVDLVRRKVTGTLRLGAGADPQDVRLSPDGTTFYVADRDRGGVWLVDAARFRKTGFIRTGRGAHGLYPSRDATVLYVTNGGARTVSLISFAGRRQIGRWRLPAAPDLGGVSPSGRVFWVSARAADAVYAVSTRTGRVVRKVRVGDGPHGLCVHPQPGRFSLGNTGNYR